MSESPIQRIPVEIWQRILVHSQSVNDGPINPLPEHGFMENILVFQDDCSIGSAYRTAERTSRRLRLVCRSWNAFLGSLPNEFVAIPSHWYNPDVWPTDERIRTANRIHCVGPFECFCPKPCRYSRKWNAKVLYRHRALLSREGFRADLHGKVTAHVLQGAIDFAKFENDPAKLADSLPNIRALSTNLHSTPSFPIQEAFPQLTHLELSDFDPNDFPAGLTLPGLTTLSISIDERTVPQPGRPGPTWNLPELLYLRVICGFSKTFAESHLHTLLQATGHGLRGLAIVSSNDFTFPDKIWSRCPNLISIGGIAQSFQGTPSPPLSVSIESVIILGLFGMSESESQVRETSHLVSKFSMWNIDHFRLEWTWEAWLLRLCHKPFSRRAEWANFLAHFGLYGKRHGPPLRDASGVAFDDSRAAFVRQALKVELSERLGTTSWTNFAFQHSN